MDVTRMAIPDWGLFVVLLLASFSLLMTVVTHVAVERVKARTARLRERADAADLGAEAAVRSG